MLISRDKDALEKIMLGETLETNVFFISYHILSDFTRNTGMSDLAIKHLLCRPPSCKNHIYLYVFIDYINSVCICRSETLIFSETLISLAKHFSDYVNILCCNVIY